MKTHLFFLAVLFSVALNAQTDKLNAYEYYELYKNGNPFEVSASLIKTDTTFVDSVFVSATQLEISKLKTEIKSLNDKITALKNIEYEKSKDIYASCITTVPTLEADMINIYNQLQIYESSIRTIKDRNLLNNQEFKEWFELYTNFIKRQSNTQIDLNQILNLNSSNVVDFILSSIATILTNTRSSKELRDSSMLMFNVLSQENSFYKNFETQIESKYSTLKTNYETLYQEINDYAEDKRDIMPTELEFYAQQPSGFVERLNDHYNEKIKTDAGTEELRSNKIQFYQILEKYLDVKESLKQLNSAFGKLNEPSDFMVVPTLRRDAIESQLNRVFLKLHGL